MSLKAESNIYDRSDAIDLQIWATCLSLIFVVFVPFQSPAEGMFHEQMRG